MTQDPLIATALLGTARMAAFPPAPDASLAPTWNALATREPADAVLQALALTRALQRAGVQSQSAPEAGEACALDSEQPLSAAAVDALGRMLKGDFSEVLPEWMQYAATSGRVLPGRVFPELLVVAGKDHSLRATVRKLAGNRGLWIAARRPEFAWLLEDQPMGDHAWDDGLPVERTAWLKQTRANDPERALEAVASHWSGEDAVMREAILRVISENPLSIDAPWLEQHALSDRRQEIRELAASALARIPDSPFRQRALDRVRGRVKLQRRLLKRVITIEPPAAFDASWSDDGIKEKPPQGTGEKAWWLRQMIAQVPLDAWPNLLDCNEDDLFEFAIESDWRDPLLLGWLDAARRMPTHMMERHVVPYFGKLTPWPVTLPQRETVLIELLDRVPVPLRFELLDVLAKVLNPPAMLELLARCRQAPPAGKGAASLAVIDVALPVLFRTVTRPQARALALCIPQDGIRARLNALAKLSELPPAAEEFATLLEFRLSLPAHFKTP